MIAVLGWGSLVWNPGALPIHRQWHLDGPFVRAEFLRQSQDGRLTLVLSDSAVPVRAMWAVFDDEDLPTAREALRRREDIPSCNAQQHVHSWSVGDEEPPSVLELGAWAIATGVRSVAWTALPPKFGGEERAPSLQEAIRYLDGLRGPARDLAEEYIRRAPRQVDTSFRRAFEAHFGWSCVGA